MMDGFIGSNTNRQNVMVHDTPSTRAKLVERERGGWGAAGISRVVAIVEDTTRISTRQGQRAAVLQE